MKRDLTGEQFGNYKLVRLLGDGGFAEVYLGQHTRLDMQAAIKVLHTHIAEEEISNFQQEAQIIAHLVHPHIVRLLDFDVRNGTPFLVLDYAPQGTLRKRHPRGTQVPLPTVVSYVSQVADALQYAHDQKLIHRDVKPENMLIGRRDEIVLSDFGIATIAHSTSSMSTQASIGTVPYMAPEQIQAHPRPASDQYALGIVVYEWLCGERPFEGSYTEIFAKHLMTPPVPLRQKLPRLSADLEQVIMTALAKDPAQRFKSIGAFAHTLEQVSKVGLSQKVFFTETTYEPRLPPTLSSGRSIPPTLEMQKHQVQASPPRGVPLVNTPPPQRQIARISPTEKPRTPKPDITVAGLLGRIFTLTLFSIGGCGGGYFLDSAQHTTSLFTVAGLFVGMIFGVFIMSRRR